MANIESIKQKILQLDPGAFQNMCDTYLCKSGYSNIVSLGGEAGTRKTTQGTPDTYFITDDEQYIFVEYTTQIKNLFAKIKDDLVKCLDVAKTSIPHDKIKEIIYCHTSSNITPSQDNEIKKLCQDAGIKLSVIGIDTLAEDLYLNYPDLTRDFLGISISTDQIQSYDDFIKCYNANKMAAPINTEFLFRDEEIEKINLAYQTVDVVILSGMAGTGKTRLALHYAKNYSEHLNAKLYCIHSNALPIYDDLKLYIDKPGSYFLFVDDANQLSGLHHVIRYVNKNAEGYNIKILITVRDYALQKVVKDIQEISSYESILISVFNDDQIKNILKSALNITNSIYLDRIVRIAEGNARLAMLAGRLACDSDCLNSIADASQLYDNYYGCFFKKDELFSDKHICITAGVVAFLGAIHLDHIDTFLEILLNKGINKETFVENIKELHEQEFIDVYSDKAVQFSEQCLANYLIKYVFFDKKLLSLSEMIDVCFKTHRERTISSINTLLNIFHNKELFNFVQQEILFIWDKLLREDSPYYFEFVKVFFGLNPTETLLLLKNKIDKEKRVNISISDIDTDEGKNDESISNDIINILGGFADMEDFPAALDLFFQYYLKRPDLYMQFYHAANRNFGISEESSYNDCDTQIIFFEKIKEYSNNWEDEFVTTLFLDMSKVFLKLTFSPIKGGRKNTFMIYRISLNASEGVKNYRKLIWESFIDICKKERYREKIRKAMISYGNNIEETSQAVLNFDFPYVKSIMASYFPTCDLSNSLLANRLKNVFTYANIFCMDFFASYFDNKQFRIYMLLRGPEPRTDIDYHTIKELKHKSIEQYISKCSLEDIKQLIDVCNIVKSIDNNDEWEISDGLGSIFNIIEQDTDYYVEAIKYYINKDTPYDLHPCKLVSSLFSFLSESEVFELLSSAEYSQKNSWLYAYYHELPKELITEKHMQCLYDFLSDPSDRFIILSPLRDIDFLDKYSRIDKHVLIKSCRIILTKMEYSPFIVNIYFALLFNQYHDTPQSVVQNFNSDLGLLEEIYFAMLKYDRNFDYDGSYLRNIYLATPSVLDEYIDFLKNDSNHISIDGCQERNRCFFELDNFAEIYNKIINQLIDKIQYPQITFPHFLKSILLPVEKSNHLLEKQDFWIKEYIQLYASNCTKMFCLFNAISELSIHRKKGYISIFLENNSSFEDFKNIPLIPTSWGGSGSLIPIYERWIEFLESLLPELIGLQWIEHKNYVQREIRHVKEIIVQEQIEEILRG